MDIKAKTSELWKKIGKYVIIGLSVLTIIIGAVLIGRWVARSDAQKLVDDLHKVFKLENKALFDNVAINQYLIDEMKKKAAIQSAEIAKIKKSREGGVIDDIKSGDKNRIAGKYDNLVDNYVVPSDFGK